MRFVAIAMCALLLVPSAVEAASPWLAPPVDAPIVRRFDPPSERWSAGHRGIDYDVPPGTEVRAAAAGTVVFAGRVPGGFAVTIAHAGGLRTTYSLLSSVDVHPGEMVGQGRWLGSAGRSHDGSDGGLHFGVKLDGAYVDPLRHLGPVDVSSAIRLAPLERLQDCRTGGELTSASQPPNENIAVAIAGIASRTEGGVDGEIFHHGPRALGYPPERIYRFSYAGTAGRRLHEPYARSDTYGDLRRAARRLRGLLEGVAQRHPGASVDLIAHSQGGIVARALLVRLLEGWERRLPRIEHLVTFSSPHSGAPLARAVEDIRRSPAGTLLLQGAARLARAGLPLPDPLAPSVRQLASGSPLMRVLAREDVVFGTRVLTLGIPHDVIVPADRALLRSADGKIVRPEGLDGHSAIVRSPAARAVAYDFLRGAPETCEDGWDRWGRGAGRAIAWAEGKIGWLYGRLEDLARGKLLRWGARAVRWAGRLVRRS